MNYNIDEAIYIDVTSFKLSDLKRYGYTIKGEEINKTIRHKHNKETITVISALSSDGIICKQLVEGSVNGEVYKQFFETNQEKFNNKIIVNDNARAHHSKIVKTFTTENNINLKFNPPYSPEFNPIEYAFNKVKCIFRKEKHDNFIADIERAFSSITQNDCINFIKKTESFINKYA